MRTLERNTSRRTHFRLYPSVKYGQPCAAVLARLRVAHHGAGAVVDLFFLTRGRLNHRTSFRRDRYLKLAHEALYALVARAEAMAIDQVLPDRYGVAAMREAQLDCFLECGEEASRRLDDRRRFRNLYQLRLCAKVGNHLIGRVCRRAPSPPARWSHRDAGSSQIARHRLPANVDRRFNAPQRPSQQPQRDHLLFLFLTQDTVLPLAGFQVIIIGRLWVITEAL